MSDLKELVVKLRADASKYTEGMKKAEGDNEKFKKSTKGLGATLAGGVGSMLSFAGSIATGIGIAGLASAGMDALQGATIGTLQAAAESQAVMAQTNAVLASTHGVSGQTAQSVNDLAGKLQLLTGADDEAIQGAENMLLTFTNIRGKAFEPATKAVLNMATAMNGGAVPSAEQLRQTSILVGKALQDPIQGVTALQRVGVKLTDQQKEQVKALMASGDVLGAQKIILGELDNEYGNAAEAAGGTFAGKLAVLQGVLGNVQEAIGGAVIPVLTNLLGAVLPLINAFAQGLPGALQAAGNVLKPIADAAGMLWQAFQDGLKPAITQLTLAFSFMQGPGDGIKSLVGQLASGFGQMAPTVKQLGSTVGGILVQAFKNAGPLLGNLGNIVSDLAPVFMDLAAHALPLVAQIIQTVGGFVAGTLLPVLSQLAGFVATNVVPIIDMLGKFLGTVFDVIATNVMPTISNLANVFMTQLLPPLQNIIQRILPPLNGLFQFLGWLLGNVIGPIIQNVIGPVLGFLFTVLGKILEAVGWVLDRLGELRDHLMQALQPAIKNVSEKLGELHSWFNDKVLPVLKQVHAFFENNILPVLQKVGGFIRDQVVSHLQDLWNIIQKNVLPILGDLGGKLKNGIGKEFQTFGNAVHDVFGKIGDLLGKLGELKDKFGGLKLEFPKIKLPHFSIVGNFSLNPPSVPHLDIKWYAGGGIFTAPSIIGVGEAGPEAVVPLNRMSDVAGGGGSTTVILEVDGRQLAKALLPHTVGEIQRRTGLRIV